MTVKSRFNFSILILVLDPARSVKKIVLVLAKDLAPPGLGEYWPYIQRVKDIAEFCG